MNAKRRKTNLANLVRHFSPKTHPDYKAHWVVPPGVLDTLPPAKLLAFMRAYNENRQAFESILSYCRKFSQAVDEITAEDIAEVSSLLKVKEVLES